MSNSKVFIYFPIWCDDIKMTGKGKYEVIFGKYNIIIDFNRNQIDIIGDSFSDCDCENKTIFFGSHVSNNHNLKNTIINVTQNSILVGKYEDLKDINIIKISLINDLLSIKKLESNKYEDLVIDNRLMKINPDDDIEIYNEEHINVSNDYSFYIIKINQKKVIIDRLRKKIMFIIDDRIDREFFYNYLKRGEIIITKDLIKIREGISENFEDRCKNLDHFSFIGLSLNNNNFGTILEKPDCSFNRLITAPKFFKI